LGFCHRVGCFGGFDDGFNQQDVVGTPVVRVSAIGEFLKEPLLAVTQGFFAHVVEREGRHGKFWGTGYGMEVIEYVPSGN
jgi:hypothetical protein